ncbi:MAG: MurR/RpiR family transcriptional regulator [Anaerolineales bacterium]|nr:MurR/RpiR family transcriptional regulator [Anaerolineales bacterium]
MSYEDLIRENRSRLSKSFARLAEYLLDSHIDAAMMTATEIAHQVDVDAATVVRFAQTLGYSGFPELHREIKDRVRDELLLRPRQDAEADSIAGMVQATLQRLQEAIEQTSMLLDAQVVADLVENMSSVRRIIVLPESLGEAAAYRLVSLLERGGFLVNLPQRGLTDLARTVATVSKDDLLLAIDIAGESPFIPRTLAEAQARGALTAAVVGAASLDSAQVADLVLAAQNQPDIGIGVVVVDAVVYTLAEALRWRYPERFEGADEAIEAIFARIQVG